MPFNDDLGFQPVIGAGKPSVPVGFSSDAKRPPNTNVGQDLGFSSDVGFAPEVNTAPPMRSLTERMGNVGQPMIRFQPSTTPVAPPPTPESLNSVRAKAGEVYKVDGIHYYYDGYRWHALEQKIAQSTEKPHFISGESTFLKAMDVINTPQQMLFGLMTKRPGELPTAAAERGARYNLGFRDVLESNPITHFALTTGTKGIAPGMESGVPEFALGLAGDIAFDPLNFIPLEKPLAIAGRGIKAGYAAAKEAPVIGKTLIKAEELAKPAAQLFSKTAFRTAGERKVIELADLSAGRLENAKADIFSQAIEREKAIRQAADASGLSLDNAKRMLAASIEEKTARTPSQLSLATAKAPEAELKTAEQIVSAPTETVTEQVARKARQLTLPSETRESIGQAVQDVRNATAALQAATPEPIRQVALQFKQQLEDTLLAEQRLGLPISALEDSQIDYLTHLLTPEARKAVADLPQYAALGRKFNPAHASELARELRGLSVVEINELAQRGTLPGFEGKIFDKFMEDDPAALLAVRQLRGAKASADLDLLHQATVDLSLPRGSAPEHWQPLAITKASDPRLKAIGEQFRNLVFEPEVAAHLNKTLETALMPEGLSKFLKTFDTVQGYWKAITLSIFPSYHTRNVVGNIWNNYLAGLSNPRFYQDAIKYQMKATIPLKFGGIEYSRDELTRLMTDYGILNRGFIATEVPQEVRSLGKIGGQARTLPGVKQGFIVGTSLENNARIAHFMWRLDAGDSPLRATRSVKKYLFDYATGLTPFEKSVMRRIFPFYSWTRFNVPLQLQALVTNPRPFVRLAEVVRTSREDTADTRLDSFQRDLLPDFIKENSGIPTRTDKNGNPEYFLLGGWLPAGDLEMLGRPDGILDKALGLLSPFIKEPIEQAFNYDSFLKRKIEDFPGEKKKFLGMDIRRRLVHASKIIRLFGEMDALTRGAGDKELNDNELTALSKATRALFGIKGFSVDVPAQLRRLKAQRQELQRRKRSLLRRGDEANADVIDQLQQEPE
jgi:hypothetical protein